MNEIESLGFLSDDGRIVSAEELGVVTVAPSDTAGQAVAAIVGAQQERMRQMNGLGQHGTARTLSAAARASRDAVLRRRFRQAPRRHHGFAPVRAFLAPPRHHATAAQPSHTAPRHGGGGHMVRIGEIGALPSGPFQGKRPLPRLGRPKSLKKIRTAKDVLAYAASGYAASMKFASKAKTAKEKAEWQRVAELYAFPYDAMLGLTSAEQSQKENIAQAVALLDQANKAAKQVAQKSPAAAKARAAKARSKKAKVAKAKKSGRRRAKEAAAVAPTETIAPQQAGVFGLSKTQLLLGAAAGLAALFFFGEKKQKAAQVSGVDDDLGYWF